MKCPICKESNLVISERKGIEIDYCPDCRGVWLDRGELDKIIEKSQENEVRQAAQEPYPQQPQYQSQNQQYPPNYNHKPYKRKKSFFEELFD